jgi:hypothetical protein
MKPISLLSLASMLLLAMLALAAQTQSGSGSGQGRSHGQGFRTPGAEEHLRLLAARLRLSENQQMRIKSILADQVAQEEAIGKDESVSPEDKVSKVRSVREATATAIRELLDDDQRKTFDEMQREHIGYGRGQGYGRGTGQGSGRGRGCQMPSVEDHLQVLSDGLNMNQDQQARLASVIEDSLAQLEAIRKDASLSPDLRTIKVRMLREATASRVRDELNDAQRKMFDEMRESKQQIMKQRRERGEDCEMIWLVAE